LKRNPPTSPIERNEASPIPKATKRKSLNNLKEGLLWQKKMITIFDNPLISV